jgi:cell division septum initiation protein DivIVA
VDPDVRKYIDEVRLENVRLVKENLNLKQRVAALEKENTALSLLGSYGTNR